MIRLTAAEIGPAAEVLVRAFEHDPMPAYVEPRPERRSRHVAACFAGVLRYGVRYGEVYASSSRLESVAMWLGPGQTGGSLVKTLRAGALTVSLRAGLRSTLRFLRLVDHLGTFWLRRVPDPHWYLAVLGTDPECRGRGLAGELVARMCQRFDREGLSCCVDTENEANTVFYRRHGFDLLDRSPVPGTSMDCWFMLRPGQTAGINCESQTTGGSS